MWSVTKAPRTVMSAPPHLPVSPLLEDRRALAPRPGAAPGYYPLPHFLTGEEG